LKPDDANMVNLLYIPHEAFAQVLGLHAPPRDTVPLLADMCRLNALTAVKRAGSGHLGSSFSSLDLVCWLYFAEMNTLRLGPGHPDRDIYFSSKGHDVPGQYAVLHAAGILPAERFLRLRRLGGVDGHPDVGVPGIEANSGSLGMGISKGRGLAWAKTRLGRGGQVYVLTGDGEFQEGQNFEALQAASHLKTGNLVVIMDHNKVQSDKPVEAILDLGDLEGKLRLFGWFVTRCDGHDPVALEKAFAQLRGVTDRPRFLIADTIKGRGVSFMEHPKALADGGGYYRWHAGAPADEVFARAHAELAERIRSRLGARGLPPVTLHPVPPLEGEAAAPAALGEPASRGAERPSMKAASEFVSEAFGQALSELGGRRLDLVVLDADLAADCKLRAFETAFPDRFIECGIAEQDMVSMAGGLARQGLLPVVNSFASFLASRANEQIYTNVGEGARIVYVCHYAGLIPAGPGKSHQSLRDISLVGAMPRLVVLQPATPAETRMALAYAVEEATESCMIRLAIGPCPRRIDLPAGYRLSCGHGVTLHEGSDAILFAYGPVMLHEALSAAEILETEGFRLKVVNLPWLNRVDRDWLRETIGDRTAVFVLEDHAPVGGLGDALLNVLASEAWGRSRRFATFAVEGLPACGTPPEVLRHHRLDGASLAARIREAR
jgi:transketolase